MAPNPTFWKALFTLYNHLPNCMSYIEPLKSHSCLKLTIPAKTAKK